MINRKLLEVLSRFEEEDRKRFDLFLRSPYFNAGSNAAQVIDLFQYILRFSADENHPALDKFRVFEVFYPGKVFVEKEKSALDTLTSDLFRLVKKFLVQRSREASETLISENLPLLKFYRKNGMEDRYQQSVNNLKKYQIVNEKKTIDSFYDSFRFEEEISIFQSMNNTYENDANIESMLKSLDTFFILSIVSHTAFLKLQKRYSSGINDNPNPLHESALYLIKKGYCSEVPLADLYIDVVEIMDEKKDYEKLNALGDKLNLYKPKLYLDDYQNLQACHRAFWGWKYMQTGQEDDKLHFFKLMQEHLEEGLYYYDGKLMTTSLTTMTNFGIAFKQFEWVHNLLKEHTTNRLTGTKFLDDVYQLNWAEYYLALKEYDKATEHLQYKMFENPMYSIQAEVVQLRIYYETENELLDGRIKALEQKIRRTAFSVELKKSLQLFVQKLDKLNKYRYQRSSPKFAKLVEEIKTTPGLVYRNWLLEKVATP